ncbi:MAG: polysaccharide deacetylase family protein [Oscillospiraceae bacterium]|jgi:peptidoglycan/xylan/chitin deacetylase (PgdA/CDA1 family)|nr:polysaccharide deacetylase family protein [Oscillospiraceae bacterium]
MMKILEKATKWQYGGGLRRIAVFAVVPVLIALAGCGGARTSESPGGSDVASGTAVQAVSTSATETTVPPAPTVDPARKMVALTFDDGPSGTVTNGILDVLEKHGARATFFCLGNRAQEYETTLRREIALGNQVASHSYAHKQLSKLSKTALLEDLKMANDALEKYSGVRPHVLRTPYGESKAELMKNVGMPVILWDIDTMDWYYKIVKNDKRSEAEIERDYRKIVDEVLDHVEDGDIVLMHDLYTLTQRAATEVVETLTKDGWQLVTIDEMFAAKGKTLEAGKYYRFARSPESA